MDEPIRHETRQLVVNLQLDYKLQSIAVYFIGNYILYLGRVAQEARYLGYELDGAGTIPGVGGVETFLYSFVSRLEAAERSTSHPTSSYRTYRVIQNKRTKIKPDIGDAPLNNLR